MSPTNRLRLADTITDPALVELGLPNRTLAESFADNSKRVGTLALAEDFSATAYRAWRKVTLDRDALNLGELYAAWLSAKLAEIEDAWEEAIDAALASGDYGDAYRAQADAADRRRRQARNAATKKAYGVTYSTFDKGTK